MPKRSNAAPIAETNSDRRLIRDCTRICELERRVLEIYETVVDDDEANLLAGEVAEERGALIDGVLSDMPTAASPDALRALARAAHILAGRDDTGVAFTEGGDSEKMALELARLVGGLPA